MCVKYKTSMKYYGHRFGFLRQCVWDEKLEEKEGNTARL